MSGDMKSIVLIAGASDPEMERIEVVARAAGWTVVYAAIEDPGNHEVRRVRPPEAYQATHRLGPEGQVDGPLPGECVVRVECGGPAVPSDAIVVDHHHEGDPGSTYGPMHYFRGSSIGQMLRLVAGAGVGWPQVERALEASGLLLPGWSVIDDIHYAAAADHCLPAAYRGNCPGIDPDRMAEWRLGQRARYQRRSQQELLADLAAAREAIAAAPRVAGMAQLALDHAGRIRHVPELPEAALREGVAYIGAVKRPGGTYALTAGGLSAEQVEQVMAAAEAAGAKAYGVPARGYAGADWTVSDPTAAAERIAEVLGRLGT